jgi:hypothetical protein
MSGFSAELLTPLGRLPAPQTGDVFRQIRSAQGASIPRSVAQQRFNFAHLHLWDASRAPRLICGHAALPRN